MGRATRRLFLAQTGAALGVSGCRSGPARQRLDVFDTMWRTVRDEYFDPTFGGLDWRAVQREWRPKAAAASTKAELYLEVLFPVLDQLQSSHVALTPPGSLLLPNGRGFRIPRQQRGRSIFMITPADEAGMGAVLTWTGTAYVVEDVVKAGPAHTAGLVPGQALQFAGLEGPGDRRELRLVDPDGAQFTVRWTPGVAASSHETRGLEGGATYLRFNAFDASSVAVARRTLTGSAGPVALDLRQNTGGLILETWKFLSTVLPEGVDLGRFKGRERDYPLSAGAQTNKFAGALAVLIGPRTASGAEATAAALQHHRRARLFGARTSGTVLASESYDLPDGGKLRLPFADYLTPAGTRIEGRGVTPDVSVVRTADSVQASSDPALDATSAWLLRGA